MVAKHINLIVICILSGWLGCKGEPEEKVEEGELEDEHFTLEGCINSLIANFWGANRLFFCCCVGASSLYIGQRWFLYVVRMGYFQQGDPIIEP